MPLLHHSEMVDPVLIEWLIDRVNHFLGFEAGLGALILGFLIVLFPLILLIVVFFQKRKPR